MVTMGVIREYVWSESVNGLCTCHCVSIKKFLKYIINNSKHTNIFSLLEMKVLKQVSKDSLSVSSLYYLILSDSLWSSNKF